MRKPALYPNTQAPAITPKRRCAVYTRKSTDEGLDKVIQATEAGELLPRVASERSFYECKYCAWARRCWREQGVSASGVQS